jgi:hypothetical protein
MFAYKARAYLNEALFRFSSHGALRVNIRLGWKSMSGTNTLAFWAHLIVTNKIKCCEYSNYSTLLEHGFESSPGRNKLACFETVPTAKETTAYLVTNVNYACKMFMKLTTGVNVIKNFLFIIINVPSNIQGCLFSAKSNISDSVRSLPMWSTLLWTRWP